MRNKRNKLKNNIERVIIFSVVILALYVISPIHESTHEIECKQHSNYSYCK